MSLVVHPFFSRIKIYFCIFFYKAIASLEGSPASSVGSQVSWGLTDTYGDKQRHRDWMDWSSIGGDAAKIKALNWQMNLRL